MKKFTQARIRLTIFYTLILIAISGSISGLYYLRTVQVMNNQIQRIEQRLLEGEVARFPRNAVLKSKVLRDELDLAKAQVRSQLIMINIFIALVGAGASYLLSGQTLDPIKKTLEAQQQFIADAAHELKTPVTALKTSLEVSLMDKKFDKKTKKVLKDNLQAVVSLESLTESLLSLARVEEGNMPNSAVDLSVVIKRAIQHIEPLAKKKKIKIKVGDHQPCSIYGNEDYFVEVLVIVLDNAIKYSTEASEVNLKVNKDKKFSSLSVLDQGPGIAKENQGKIFERFYRVDVARSNSTANGHGLGLAVAKKLMTKMGGYISVTSQDNQGSTFILKFPLKN
ncbi:MAG: HAMP domain-containing sensor histidine kinase [Patescibacteria group bacterium]|nr:HAMP domain-containing sensor histidine kinase [Patescibacteria group bacterium]